MRPHGIPPSTGFANPIISNTTSSSSSKPRIFTPTTMSFNPGDQVEVSSKEQGFQGSYYEATVVAKITRKNQYVVEYKTLMDDNYSEQLKEVVEADAVRPCPPALEKPPKKFYNGDRVEAFDNDGWWVGTINGMDVKEGKYRVVFPWFLVELPYHPSKLRVHQEWKDGKWSTWSSFFDDLSAD